MGQAAAVPDLVGETSRVAGFDRHPVSGIGAAADSPCTVYVLYDVRENCSAKSYQPPAALCASTFSRHELIVCASDTEVGAVAVDVASREKGKPRSGDLRCAEPDKPQVDVTLRFEDRSGCAQRGGK